MLLRWQYTPMPRTDVKKCLNHPAYPGNPALLRSFLLPLSTNKRDSYANYKTFLHKNPPNNYQCQLYKLAQNYLLLPGAILTPTQGKSSCSPPLPCSKLTSAINKQQATSANQHKTPHLQLPSINLSNNKEHANQLETLHLLLPGANLLRHTAQKVNYLISQYQFVIFKHTLALPWFHQMEAGTLLNIPDSEGRSAQSTHLEAVHRVEHQRNGILPSLWLCTKYLTSFPVPASHSNVFSCTTTQP